MRYESQETVRARTSCNESPFKTSVSFKRSVYFNLHKTKTYSPLMVLNGILGCSLTHLSPKLSKLCHQTPLKQTGLIKISQHDEPLLSKPTESIFFLMCIDTFSKGNLSPEQQLQLLLPALSSFRRGGSRQGGCRDTAGGMPAVPALINSIVSCQKKRPKRGLESDSKTRTLRVLSTNVASHSTANPRRGRVGGGERGARCRVTSRQTVPSVHH